MLPPILYSAWLVLAAAQGEAAEPASACPFPFVARAPLERGLAGGRAELSLDLEADRYIRLFVDQASVAGVEIRAVYRLFGDHVIAAIYGGLSSQTMLRQLLEHFRRHGV